MKRLIICSIPMQLKSATIYKSTDASVPSSERAVVFPINAFLEKTVNPKDDIRVLMLVKKSPEGSTDKTIDVFKQELEAAIASSGATIDLVQIDSDFSQEKATHARLLSQIIDNIEDGDHIVCDVTYGPKDMPIIIFTACSFAENHLGCQIDNIIYGQAEFDENGIVKNTMLCDMSPLYYLNSVTTTLKSDNPQKAKTLFKALLSI